MELWQVAFEEILRSSAMQTLQSYDIHIQKTSVETVAVMRLSWCSLWYIGLQQVVPTLYEALRNRCVSVISRPVLPTPSNSISFVLSGVHVSTLFGLAPVNDIAHVYGYLSINNNQLNGVIRLVLCVTTLHSRIWFVWFREMKTPSSITSSIVSVLMLFFVLVFTVGRDWKSVLAGNMQWV